MSTNNQNKTHDPQAPDHPVEGQWAHPVDRLTAEGIAPEAINANVTGRHLSGPMDGFGQLWRKTYRIRLVGADVTPQEVAARWKQKYGSYWPSSGKFYAPLAEIEPGEVAVINLTGPGGMPMSTGVMVVYADDESFAFMTPEGHPFAGLITYGAEEDGDDVDDQEVVAQIQVLVRASDPIFEMGARLGVVHKSEDVFWAGTLTNLAADWGVTGQGVQQKDELMDDRVQWGRMANVWHNSAIRTTLYLPVHAMKRLAGR